MSDAPRSIPFDPAADPELTSVDTALRRGMDVDPPPGLADRIFHASRHHLPDSAHPGAPSERPAARIGPLSRYGRLAAAAALVLIGSGLALRGLDQPTADPDTPDLESFTLETTQPVDAQLDADIQALAQQIGTMDDAGAGDESALLPDEQSLAWDLAQLESELDMERF